MGTLQFLSAGAVYTCPSIIFASRTRQWNCPHHQHMVLWCSSVVSWMEFAIQHRFKWNIAPLLRTRNFHRRHTYKQSPFTSFD
jgi:hypothetical protein